jgi:hypothetical protein
MVIFFYWWLHLDASLDKEQCRGTEEQIGHMTNLEGAERLYVQPGRIKDNVGRKPHRGGETTLASSWG